MKEIEQVYHNDFGVAFYWKIDGKVYKERIRSAICKWRPHFFSGVKGGIL